MTLLLLLLGAAPLSAQRVETVPFGDFEHWRACFRRGPSTWKPFRSGISNTGRSGT